MSSRPSTVYREPRVENVPGEKLPEMFKVTLECIKDGKVWRRSAIITASEYNAHDSVSSKMTHLACVFGELFNGSPAETGRYPGEQDPSSLDEVFKRSPCQHKNITHLRPGVVVCRDCGERGSDSLSLEPLPACPKCGRMLVRLSHTLHFNCTCFVGVIPIRGDGTATLPDGRVVKA